MKKGLMTLFPGYVLVPYMAVGWYSDLNQFGDIVYNLSHVISIFCYCFQTEL